MGAIKGDDYRTNWAELLSFYNSTFGTNHKKLKTMLKEGYKQFKSLKEFSIKLDISPETLRLKLIQAEIKLNPAGSQRNKTTKQA